jgi:CRP-like cAMP-binding protein
MSTNMWRNAREVVKVDAGECVFGQGDPGDVMYAVVEGRVDIALDGKFVESVGEGGIFGELALVEDGPRNATATAALASRLARVDREHFIFLVHEHPTFALQVMSVLAARLRRANARA